MGEALLGALESEDLEELLSDGELEKLTPTADQTAHENGSTPMESGLCSLGMSPPTGLVLASIFIKDAAQKRLPSYL